MLLGGRDGAEQLEGWWADNLSARLERPLAAKRVMAVNMGSQNTFYFMVLLRPPTPQLPVGLSAELCLNSFDNPVTWGVFYPHFTDEKIKAQRGGATYLRC